MRTLPTSRFSRTRQLQRKRVTFGALDATAFAVGAFAPYSIHLIGTIQISEVLMFVLLPLLLIMRSGSVLQRGMKTVYMLMSFWLLGQIVTDIYRHTVLFNWMRGDARVLFFALNLATLTLLLSKNVRRQALFVLGYGIGSLLAVRIQPSAAAGDYPWKFGYAEGTMVLVLLLSCYFHSRKRYWIAGSLIASLIVVNLLLNFRSPILFLMVTLALVIPIVPDRVGRMRLLPRAGSPKRVLVLVCIALTFGTFSGLLVSLVTRAGLVSAGAKEKNSAQEHSSLGLLLGGRPEILVSSQAVMASPILGYGSWAQNLKYTEMYYDMAIKYDIPIDDLQSIEDADDSTIPAHSHLMSTWIQAGILGAIFWVYVTWIVLKGLSRVALTLPPLAPFITWLLVSFMWDVFFSPFGNTRRSIDSLVILLALEMIERFPMGDAEARRRFGRSWKRRPPQRCAAMSI